MRRADRCRYFYFSGFGLVSLQWFFLFSHTIISFFPTILWITPLFLFLSHSVLLLTLQIPKINFEPVIFFHLQTFVSGKRVISHEVFFVWTPSSFSSASNCFLLIESNILNVVLSLLRQFIALVNRLVPMPQFIKQLLKQERSIIQLRWSCRSLPRQQRTWSYFLGKVELQWNIVASLRDWDSICHIWDSNLGRVKRLWHLGSKNRQRIIILQKCLIMNSF